LSVLGEVDEGRNQRCGESHAGVPGIRMSEENMPVGASRNTPCPTSAWY
jgi:hypothetical protein